MARRQTWKSCLFTAAWLGAVATQASAATPVLSIDATPDPAVLGSSVSLDILITGIQDLYAYQYTLSFNPAVLQATGVSEGSFLASGGTTYFDGGTIDNTLGSISFAFDTLIGPGPGVSGSGALAHISFNVTHAGSSTLSFSDVLFLDSSFGDLGVQADTRILQAVPEPASFALLGAGLAGLAAWRRRQAA
jgi:hypothetical protein